MNMLERFFSIEYAGWGSVFEGLSIWREERYRGLQGTYPVIMLSFASVKETTYENTRKKLCHIITELYNRYDFLLDSECLNEKEKEYYRKVSVDMEDYTATEALKAMSGFLMRYYGKKVIILLDEYDTPMQEAYVCGYWEELAAFTRSLFNAAFKTNPYMERAIMTGTTRISRESMFSDLNNLEVVTATSEKYKDRFGFTQEEVSGALEEFSLAGREEEVKQWYDGFVFGSRDGIYNPWSVLNYLDKKKAGAYWANTSSNSLAGTLIREGSPELKMVMEKLLQGETLHTALDEQIVFSQLDQGDEAVWSLLLASGYLKVLQYGEYGDDENEDTIDYELCLTNREVRKMFRTMIKGWFRKSGKEYNGFIKALLEDDIKSMNYYMNQVALATFSSFDTGKKPSGKAQPERFYHGFVLGLMVDLQDRYVITSNRESGFGRYDIMLEPKRGGLDGYIIEFKVIHTERGETLEDGVKSALKQIEEKQYETALRSRGTGPERIKKYGFAFEGRRVLIGKNGGEQDGALQRKAKGYEREAPKGDPNLRFP